MTCNTSWEEIKSHYRVNHRDFPVLSEDTPRFKGRPHPETLEDLASASVAIIGAL